MQSQGGFAVIKGVLHPSLSTVYLLGGDVKKDPGMVDSRGVVEEVPMDCRIASRVESDAWRPQR